MRRRRDAYKVVGQNTRVAPLPFEIDLVQRFGLQDCTRDDALARRDLHDYLETTEKHVEFGTGGWCVARTLYREGSALFHPVDFAPVRLDPDLVVAGNAGLIEVEGGVAAEGLHGRASCGVERVAERVGLRKGGGHKRGQKREGRGGQGLHLALL